MPSEKKHKKVWKNLIFIPIFISLFFLFFGRWYFSIWIMAGYFLHGVFGITNDLDLISITSDEAKWIKSVVFIPIIVWSTLYARIASVFGGHRSFFSHSVFFSSVIRLLWFGFPILLLLRQFYFSPVVTEFFGLCLGLSIADAIHTALDWSEKYFDKK